MRSWSHFSLVLIWGFLGVRDVELILCRFLICNINILFKVVWLLALNSFWLDLVIFHAPIETFAAVYYIAKLHSVVCCLRTSVLSQWRRFLLLLVEDIPSYSGRRLDLAWIWKNHILTIVVGRRTGWVEVCLSDHVVLFIWVVWLALDANHQLLWRLRFSQFIIRSISLNSLLFTVQILVRGTFAHFSSTTSVALIS